MLRIHRQRTDKRTTSPSSELGITEQPAGPGTQPLRRSAKRRLLAPLARFLGWWAGLFAFLAAFSVCPFCGQPGCAGGPAFAGVLGGISAFFLSALRLGRRRQKAPRCGLSHDLDCADHIQLNTVTRPSAHGSATELSREPLAQSSRLSDPPAEVVADYRHGHEQAQFSVTRDEILGLLRTRPCSINRIAQRFSIHPNNLLKYVEALQADKLVETSWTSGKCYYRATDQDQLAAQELTQRNGRRKTE